MRFLIIAAMIFSTTVKAEILTSRIHSIDNGIVKFENGRVAFLDSKNLKLSAADHIKAQLDENSSIIHFEKIHSFKNIELLPEETTPAPTFEPSIVPSMKEAYNIFHRSNSFYKRISECSDRAHVWAHDEFKFSGTKSMKAFIFFTASYINSVRFKWWFHVAPMYKVKDGGTIKDMVMDFRYADRPLTIKEWSDQFVYTKRSCKVTTKFSEYDVNPQTENCYMIFESMHYKIPGEIHQQEVSGRFKSKTTEYELNTALKLGFEQRESHE